jgi:enoyl-CoA hydratase/carnithine racemase
VLWGLINEVVPHDALLSRARELAAAIVGLPQAAAENMVRLYARRQESLLGDARRDERETTAAWSVDRDASRRDFDGQRVSPPST